MSKYFAGLLLGLVSSNSWWLALIGTGYTKLTKLITIIAVFSTLSVILLSIYLIAKNWDEL